MLGFNAVSDKKQVSFNKQNSLNLALVDQTYLYYGRCFYIGDYTRRDFGYSIDNNNSVQAPYFAYNRTHLLEKVDNK